MLSVSKAVRCATVRFGPAVRPVQRDFGLFSSETQDASKPAIDASTQAPKARPVRKVAGMLPGKLVRPTYTIPDMTPEEVSALVHQTATALSHKPLLSKVSAPSLRPIESIAATKTSSQAAAERRREMVEKATEHQQKTIERFRRIAAPFLPTRTHLNFESTPERPLTFVSNKIKFAVMTDVLQRLNMDISSVRLAEIKSAEMFVAEINRKIAAKNAAASETKAAAAPAPANITYMLSHASKRNAKSRVRSSL